MADKDDNKSADNAGKGKDNTSWADIVREVTGLTAGTPWWARALIVPSLVLTGIVFITNPGIGNILLENLLLLIQDLRDSVVDGAKSASNWATEKKDELVTALNNYFSEQRLARWRFNRNLYLIVAGVFIIVGLWNHATSIFLFVGILMLALPLLVIGLILANAGKEHWWNGLGGYILYAIAIVLLIVGLWMFIPNLVIWGVVITLWLGTILFFKPLSRSKNGIKTVFTTLCFFIGAMLIGKIIVWGYDQFPTIQRTVDAVQSTALGTSARALKGGTRIQDGGENTLMVAKFPTDVFREIPKKIDENTGELIGENLLDLKVGDTIRVSNVSPKLDALGRSLVPGTFRDKNTNKLRQGWVALGDLEELKPLDARNASGSKNGDDSLKKLALPAVVSNDPNRINFIDGGQLFIRPSQKVVEYNIGWNPPDLPVIFQDADGVLTEWSRWANQAIKFKPSVTERFVSIRSADGYRLITGWWASEREPLPEKAPKPTKKTTPK